MIGSIIVVDVEMTSLRSVPKTLKRGNSVTVGDHDGSDGTMAIDALYFTE